MSVSHPLSVPPAASVPVTGPVLLFDGECGLCKRTVGVLLRLDRRGAVRYAPLQGSTAQAYLRAHGLPTEDFDSIVWVPAWERRERAEFALRTDGALAALRATGSVGRVLAAPGGVLPQAWRDTAYRGVARWRYRLFGEARPQASLKPEWAARFLP